MDAEVRALYDTFIRGWNARDAARVAAPFASNATVIGFDGSLMSGAAEIAETMAAIFRDHTPATYVAKVREVTALGQDGASLRADAGMVPPGGSSVMPQVNTRHVVTATREDGEWKIAVLQSTPAALHGRPDLVDAFTAEMQELV